MAGEKTYLRVPPDSTGKRVRMNHTAQIAYNTKTVGYTWKINEYYTLSTGWSFHLHAVFEETSTSGILDVSYSKTALYTNLNPAAGNTIIDQDTSATVATVVSATEIYVNAQNIVGYENTEHGLDIDNTGSANIRFAEGLPQLDSFGKLRVSGASLLGEYVFSNGLLETQFSGTFEGGGDASWDNNARALILSTTTDSTSHASYTTNTYHHYFPGSSYLFIGTVAAGDAGKANLTREWGMFDDRNGFFFYQKNGVLGVGFRSNVTGSVVETLIPQADWNKDVANGLGASKMDLDETKDNIYWIDTQWLGAGRIRYGTYHLGQRVVLHEHYAGNVNATSITAMANLPICIHQHNTGTTGSSSEIRAFCLAMWTESNLDVRVTSAPALRSFSKTISSAIGTYEYLGTLAPTPVLSNGQPNRSLYWPNEIEVVGWDTVTGEPAKFEFEIYAEPVIASPTWNAVPGVSTVQYDTTGTFILSGNVVSQRFINGKDMVDTTTTFNNMQHGAFKNYSENGGTVIQNITGITQANDGAIVTLGSATRSSSAVPSGRTYFRDGEAITITGVSGMTQVNGNTYYARPVAANQIKLYTDSGMTTPLNSSAFTAYTSGGIGTGVFGSRFLFTMTAKKLFGSNPIQVYAKIAWREVVQ